MLKHEQIPDVVVDALLDSSNVAQPWKHAIAAALNAWPGMQHRVWWNPGGPQIILPLTEARDE